MNIRFGFSTGCFYKSPLGVRERLALIGDAQCSAVELGFVKLESFEAGADELLRSDFVADAFGPRFDYISLHAPVFNYGANEETERIFELIRKLNQKILLDSVVFHPDTVTDFEVFKYAGFGVAFENMDNRKAAYKTPEEFEHIFEKNENLSIVLDANHIYTNNPSMALAAQFLEKFRDRIVEVHMSGYAGYHEPLFKMPAEQKKIIKAIQGLRVPIIVESVLAPEELAQERDYILEVLGSP